MSRLESLKRQAPTGLVLAALACLAIFGHRTGWRIGKFSEVTGTASSVEKEDWCEAHNVPDSRCLACHPELGGADPKDWCKEHGVPESKCTVCHPEILTSGQARDWCREHGIPESQCTLCHPEIAVKGEVAGGGGPAKVVIEPSAKPKKDPLTCQTHAIRVQFASPESVRKAGIELAKVVERPMADTLAATGAEIAYDQTRFARLSSRVPGTVWRVDAELGRKVRKGDLLALVDSVQVGRAKADLLQAIALVNVREKTLERVRASTEGGFRSRGELQLAEAELEQSRIERFNAQQTLLNLGLSVRIESLSGVSAEKLAEMVRVLGLPEAVTRTVDASAVTANLLPILAPFDGTVVSRDAVPGEVVEDGKALFVVADTSRMWIVADVRLEDAARIEVGQPLVFRPDGNGEGVAGAVAWVSTEADEKTRAVRVRASVENPEGRLRAMIFGTARITVRSTPGATAMPDEAVHWEGCCHIVFVRLTDDIFQTRKVKLGATAAGFTEVIAGVLPGEVVATVGSHVLKSEVLKSSLGAGCVDD